MMELGGASVSGPRPYNEDNLLTIDMTSRERELGGLQAFLMVSDGMGGHQGGDVASRVAIESAADYVNDLMRLAEQAQLEVDARKALEEIGAEAHAAVRRAAEERGGSNMGATLVAAFVGRKQAWIGHIGDSRAYLIRDGEARQLTVDHSQVGRMIAEGILTEEQAQHHPSRNVIDKALGFEGSDVEVTEVSVRPGDVLVLCSDGLSTVLSGTDIAHIAASQPNADKAAQALTDEAIKAGTDDNTTAVVWCEDWSLFRMSVPQLRTTRQQASRARREGAKHRNASKTSLYAAALLVVVLGVVLAVAMNGPKGGTVVPAAAPAAGPKEATASVDASAVPGARKPQTGERIVVNRGVNLRKTPSVTEDNIRFRTKKKTKFTLLPMSESTSVKDAKGVQWRQVDPNSDEWPADVERGDTWIAEGVFTRDQ